MDCVAMPLLFIVWMNAAAFGFPMAEQKDPNTSPYIVISEVSITTTKDIMEINEGRGGLFQGDILPLIGRNVIIDESRYWTNATVPIVLSASLNFQARVAIDLAIQEFKLRTCIDIDTRTTETNYISIEPQNGCFSSVGMRGGSQTLSIGNGCETTAIVVHEFMHALGIFHEQSRPDRDDYVLVLTQNVENDKVHNFNKYTWTTTNVRRQPYDYYSIMHYSPFSFSSNSMTTIQTKDPTFQNVIGQRSTFSRSDSNKINQMYDCSDTLLLTYSCNFEDDAICGYVKDYSGDNTDWIRYKVGKTSVTAPENPPATDSTFGIANKGNYMLLDTNATTSGQTGQLRSMRLLSRSTTQCLQFYFYLDRAVGSSSSITVHVAQISSTTGEITSLGDPVLTLNQDYGNFWQLGRISITAPSIYRLVFVATTGSSSDDVIAIDDVSVQDKQCESGYAVYHGFSSLVNNSAPRQFFRSSRFYTDDGYRYIVGLYPAGASNPRSGYISVWFGLVEGVNDANLTWPFRDRQIRLMIVDQNDNPLDAMNKYFAFQTNSGLASFAQPNPGSIRLYGYSQFARVSELMSTQNFSKGDKLVVSVLITRDSSAVTEIDTTTSETTTTDQPSTPQVYTAPTTTIDSKTATTIVISPATESFTTTTTTAMTSQKVTSITDTFVCTTCNNSNVSTAPELNTISSLSTTAEKKQSPTSNPLVNTTNNLQNTTYTVLQTTANNTNTTSTATRIGFETVVFSICFFTAAVNTPNWLIG